MSRKVLGCGLAVCLSLVVPTVAQEPAAQCSLLAASPYDPATPIGAGVALEAIDATAAIPACQAAVDAAGGNARMIFQLGRAQDAGGSFEAAIGSYRAAMAIGYPVAIVALGGLYELGLGVEADAGAALRLYQQAFDESALPIAAANLGYAYDAGIGVDADKARAAHYYAIASDGGIAWASTSLGWLYEQGLGVGADYARAVTLYQAAAAAGDADAANNLGVAYENGQGGLTRSVEQAIAHYELAAKGGSGLAMANLGDVYAYGRQGLAKDAAKAHDYYRAAIDSGAPNVVARAQNSLAWHFVLTNRDLDEAEQLATAALAHDPQDAAVLDTLGWIKHVRGDGEAALAHLLEAAALKPATTQLAHLGAVQAASGDAAAARKSYEAALAALPPDYEEPTVDVNAIKSWLAAN